MVVRLEITLAAFCLLATVDTMGKTPPPEQAVIVHFDYGHSDWSAFFTFEEHMEAVVTKANVGEYDGNELATDGSDGYLYFYGPDADKLFAVVKSQLLSAAFLKNIRVTLRYGSVDDQNARETHLTLGGP